MKQFENLNQLYDYLTYCPLCRSNNMDLKLKIKSYGSGLVKFEKKDNKLNIYTIVKLSFLDKSYKADYIIDCSTGKIGIDVNDLDVDYDPLALDQTTAAYSIEQDEKQKEHYYVARRTVNFYFHSTCNYYRHYEIHTTEMSFNLANLQLNNFNINKEYIECFDEENNNTPYFIVMDHVSDLTSIHVGTSFSVPVVIKATNFDISHTDKLLRQVRTCILMS